MIADRKWLQVYFEVAETSSFLRRYVKLGAAKFFTGLVNEVKPTYTLSVWSSGSLDLFLTSPQMHSRRYGGLKSNKSVSENLWIVCIVVTVGTWSDALCIGLLLVIPQLLSCVEALLVKMKAPPFSVKSCRESQLTIFCASCLPCFGATMTSKTYKGFNHLSMLRKKSTARNCAQLHQKRHSKGAGCWVTRHAGEFSIWKCAMFIDGTLCSWAVTETAEPLDFFLNGQLRSSWLK